MRTLRLVALSDDGTSLVLTAEDGDGGEERFLLPIDERVRAAARGDARLGAIEDVGNTLPPRVIQARIRAGETPEQVAAASGTRVERIMRFAHPVLQERERIAEQARDARVRLSDGTPTVGLQKFMTERLRLLGADGDAVSWDAHRDADGTWLVTGTWRAGHKSGTTRWSYDIAGRTITPVDAATTDFAEGTRLVRVVPDVPGGAVAVPASRRPMSSIRPVERAGEQGTECTPRADPGEDGPDHADHYPDGSRVDDTARGVTPADGTSPSVDLLSVDHPSDGGVPGDAPGDVPGGVPNDIPDDIAEHDTVVLGRPGEEGEAEDPRARVPAWEDIVFGVRRNR